MYKRCIKQDQNGDDEWGESILAACGAVSSLRRILDALQNDLPLMYKVEEIIYPVLLHSLTVDGLDAIEEGIECITILLYYGYKTNPISSNLWRLFPQLLYVCAGSEGQSEGGFGLEFASPVIVTLKNYISRDTGGLFNVGDNQDKTYIELLFHFIRKILLVNRNGKHMSEGVSIMNLIMSLIENMVGKIDNYLATLIEIITGELKFAEENKDRINYSKYKSMIL